MNPPAPSTRRFIAVVLLAVALLVGLIVLTGGGVPGIGSSDSTNSPPTNEAPATAAPATGKVAGSLSVRTAHGAGHTWRFIYTIHNSGIVPIAGFQLNGPTANLFQVARRPQWSSFGTGICGGQPPGVLVYWSTSASSSTLIAPGQSAEFGFSANTSGTTSIGYSLSWSSATPLFGKTTGPLASSLPATGPCRG